MRHTFQATDAIGDVLGISCRGVQSLCRNVDLLAGGFARMLLPGSEFAALPQSRHSGSERTSGCLKEAESGVLDRFRAHPVANLKGYNCWPTVDIPPSKDPLPVGTHCPIGHPKFSGNLLVGEPARRTLNDGGLSSCQR